MKLPAKMQSLTRASIPDKPRNRARRDGRVAGEEDWEKVIGGKAALMESFSEVVCRNL